MITKKTKLYGFLGGVVGLTVVILYLDATNQQDEAGTIALATVGVMFLAVLAFVLFGKKKLPMPVGPMAPPAPIVNKNYSFY